MSRWPVNRKDSYTGLQMNAVCLFTVNWSTTQIVKTVRRSTLKSKSKQWQFYPRTYSRICSPLSISHIANPAQRGKQVNKLCRITTHRHVIHCCFLMKQLDRIISCRCVTAIRCVHQKRETPPILNMHINRHTSTHKQGQREKGDTDQNKWQNCRSHGKDLGNHDNHWAFKHAEWRVIGS